MFTPTRIYIHGIGANKHDWFERYRGLFSDNYLQSVESFYYDDLLQTSGYQYTAGASRFIVSKAGEYAYQLSGAYGALARIGLGLLANKTASWVNDYAADVPAYLADHTTMLKVLERLHTFIQGKGPVELHGHSLGGAVADEYCRRFPRTNVIRLVTYGCPQGKRVARTLLELRSGPPNVHVPWVNYHGNRDWVAGYPIPTPWGRQSTALPLRYYPCVKNVELPCWHSFGNYLQLAPEGGKALS